jgi:hypothetical protein
VCQSEVDKWVGKEQECRELLLLFVGGRRLLQFVEVDLQIDQLIVRHRSFIVVEFSSDISTKK